MKVWILTTGDYSDYTIQGAYSSLEAANAVRRAVFPQFANEPFEIELDAMPPECPPGKQFYRVEMDRDGNVPPGAVRQVDYLNTEFMRRPFEDEFMWAESPEQAVKIRADRRRVKLAKADEAPTDSGLQTPDSHGQS